MYLLVTLLIASLVVLLQLESIDSLCQFQARIKGYGEDCSRTSECDQNLTTLECITSKCNCRLGKRYSSYSFSIHFYIFKLL